MLQLFTQYETHVTWATVGLLGHENRAELLSANHTIQIPYKNKNFSPFPFTDKKISSVQDDLLLGAASIRKILATKHQEFASHTYSHYYTLEEGQTDSHFSEDLEKMHLISQKFETEIKSIVFPRNQINTSFLELCKEKGVRAYRGNQENKFWRNSSFEKESSLKKAGRVLDAYVNIFKTKSYKISELPVQNGLINIPANRFLRAYTGSAFLEKRKIIRIKNELYKAAKNGTVYHLWWHPHNFVKNLDASLIELEEILAYVSILKNKFGMTSLNMGEIGAYAK